VLSERQETLPSEVPTPVKALIGRCLEKDPAKRFATMADVHAELTRLRGLADTGRLKPPVSTRRRVALAVACAVVVGAVAGWLWSRPKAPVEPPSIAVLPFTNATGDQSSQYLVNGLTEELTTELKKVRTIRVAEPSAAAAYKTMPRDLADIGRRLNVTYLVEASVERAGDYLKVTSSLERASGAKVWTNTYQRPTKDLNEIEADLAAGVRSSLGLGKPAKPAVAFVPPEAAHDLYLKARFEDDGSSVASNEQAMQDYQRAIALEPRYAAAYSALASAYWNRHILLGQAPATDDLSKAQHYWQKAEDLDPRFSAARSGLASYVMQYDWDWNHAERELKAALADGPTIAAESTYAWLCVVLGRLTEADTHLRRARDLDQQSWVTSGNSTGIFRLERRFAEARAEAQKLATRNPTAFGPRMIVSLTYAEEGNPDEGIQSLRPLLAKQPSLAMPLAWCQAMAGNREEALRTLRPLEEHFAESHLQNYYFAMAYAAIGDKPNTMKWLERSMDAREFQALYIRVEPMFAPFQDTPEFHALKKRMNLDW
jgi:TolB-like protein